MCKKLTLTNSNKMQKKISSNSESECPGFPKSFTSTQLLTRWQGVWDLSDIENTQNNINVRHNRFDGFQQLQQSSATSATMHKKIALPVGQIYDKNGHPQTRHYLPPLSTKKQKTTSDKPNQKNSSNTTNKKYNPSPHAKFRHMQSSWSVYLPEATRTPIPPPTQFKADKNRGQDMDGLPTNLDVLLRLHEVPAGFNSDQTPAVVAASSLKTQTQVKHTSTKQAKPSSSHPRKSSIIARFLSRKSTGRIAQIWRIRETDAAELLSNFELAQTTCTMC